MKNSVAVAVAVALVVVLIGGAVALYIMLRGGGDYEFLPPENYAGIDCDVFLKFDTTANLGEVYDQAKPLLGLFKEEIDEEFQGFLDIDYDFLDIAGFFTTDDDGKLVIGIRLSGEGNPKREIDKIVDVFSEIQGMKIASEEDYYISDDVVLYLDKGYVLISQDKDPIEYVLGVKNGDTPSITQLDNWDKIDSVMESPYLSFYAQPVIEREKRVQVAGSIYIDEASEEAGFAIALIEGRDQIKDIDPKNEEFAGLIDSVFDSARDLSDILSMTPNSPIRGALSFIPDFAGIETEENIAIDGLMGLWVDMIDFERDIGDYIGAIFLPDDMTASELMNSIFVEDEYNLVQDDGGYLVYDKID
nr:hypothetical protein [Caldisericia bacterium]